MTIVAQYKAAPEYTRLALGRDVQLAEAAVLKLEKRTKL